MKEEKVGKKPKGMVLVISVGKPTGKKPEREADPDTKKKSISFFERGVLDQIRRNRGPARYVPTQLSAETPAERMAKPRPVTKIPGAMNRMGVSEANEFNSAMANTPEAKMRHLQHMAEVEARKRAEELADEDYQQPYTDAQGNRINPNRMALKAILKGEPVNFCTCCSPAEIAWAIAKAKKKSKPFHGYNPKRHHKKGGLNAKGRAKFKRETGANLKPPVTTKPSKLKPGSKRAKRRKSFCARMSGSKGPTSKDGKLTPKGAALKRWNC